MKPNPWDWLEEDLLLLIREGTQESLTLDYKQSDALQRSDAKKNELSKDVSSFANSAGGTIVYGMKEDGHLPISLDDGFDPDVISKEWLEQVINSRIQRRIEGIRVNQVQLSNPAGRVAYIVFVPQSTRAPHQAADKRFYKRFNFEAVPMEEYEVRDTANRTSVPDIHIDLRFKPGGEVTQLEPGNDGYFKPVKLFLLISNESATATDAAVLHLYLDSRIKLGDLPRDCRECDPPELRFIVEVKSISLSKLTIVWNKSQGMPIFKGITAELPSTPLHLHLPMEPGVYVARYEVAAPGMEPKSRIVLITTNAKSATISVPHENSPPIRVSAV